MPEQETAANVRTGETVTTQVATPQESYAAALQREREGYVRRGLDGRVADVDAELQRVGHDGQEETADGQDGAETGPPETAAESKPRRTARGTAKG